MFYSYSAEVLNSRRTERRVYPIGTQAITLMAI